MTEYKLKGKHSTSDRRLDRLPEFDKKSRRFGVAERLPDRPPRSYSWRTAKVLDQGEEGACVGFAWTHELICRPVIQPSVDDRFARQVYREAQELDDWPGEGYEGTSVLAGAKAITARGHMVEYRWGFSIDDLVMSLSYAGPVVLGLNWYTGMMHPGSDFGIRPTGQVEGGHAICAYGVNVTARRISLVNSWGVDWGDRGLCWVGWDDMDRLLHEKGEQCIPMGRQRVPVLRS